MGVLTSPIFWIIIVAIIVVMAIIGYLAEGTEFANKALKNTKNNKAKNAEKNKDTTSASSFVGNINQGIQEAVPNNIDASAPEVPNAWNGDIVKEDERKETTYDVPAVDDWSIMPDSLVGEDTVNSSENIEAPAVFEQQNPVDSISDEVPVNSDLDISENSSEVSSEVDAPEVPNAWNGDIVKEDERKETTYDVPAVDDWSIIPTGDINSEATTISGGEVIPEVNHTEDNQNINQDAVVETPVDNSALESANVDEMVDDVFGTIPVAENKDAMEENVKSPDSIEPISEESLENEQNVFDVIPETNDVSASGENTDASTDNNASVNDPQSIVNIEMPVISDNIETAGGNETKISAESAKETPKSEEISASTNATLIPEVSLESLNNIAQMNDKLSKLLDIVSDEKMLNIVNSVVSNSKDLSPNEEIITPVALKEDEKK